MNRGVDPELHNADGAGLTRYGLPGAHNWCWAAMPPAVGFRLWVRSSSGQACAYSLGDSQNYGPFSGP